MAHPTSRNRKEAPNPALRPRLPPPPCPSQATNPPNGPSQPNVHSQNGNPRFPRRPSPSQPTPIRRLRAQFRPAPQSRQLPTNAAPPTPPRERCRTRIGRAHIATIRPIPSPIRIPPASRPHPARTPPAPSPHPARTPPAPKRALRLRRRASSPPRTHAYISIQPSRKPNFKNLNRIFGHIRYKPYLCTRKTQRCHSSVGRAKD